MQRLADETERAWQALIAADWPRLRALLEADIGYRSRQLADGGLERLLADLHPNVSWADGTLAVGTRSQDLLAQDLAGQGVLLMPSVFVWPSTVSGYAPPWRPGLMYPARGVGGLWQRPDGNTAGPLIRLLGANRAAILTGLDEPAPTAELARRHGLAPSSVSAHLSVLREAGLLTSHRHGHQVRYELTPLGIALVSGG